MKRSIISAAVLSAVFMSSGAFAVEGDTGTLNIIGTVVGTSCQFKSGHTSEDVVLGQVETNKFDNQEAGFVYTGITEKTEKLVINCSDIKEGNKLSITIKAPNLDDKGVIGNTASNGAKGVGFVLKYKNAAITNSTNNIEVSFDELKDGKDYVVPLDVYYAKQGSTPVTSGDVNATVTLQAAYN